MQQNGFVSTWEIPVSQRVKVVFIGQFSNCCTFKGKRDFTWNVQKQILQATEFWKVLRDSVLLTSWDNLHFGGAGIKLQG